MPRRVLISDALSPGAVAVFKDRGVEVEFQPGLGKDKEKLAAMIGDFDGLAIRSETKVTAEILASAKKLKVIGRAGIGVDNVVKADIIFVSLPGFGSTGPDKDYVSYASTIEAAGGLSASFGYPGEARCFRYLSR